MESVLGESAFVFMGFLDLLVYLRKSVKIVLVLVLLESVFVRRLRKQ
jgi:hypothetical protein